MFKNIRYDIKSIIERDPAARNGFEVFFLYPGFKALIYYKISHFLFEKKCFFLARWVSQSCKFWTGVEIHPGATIGRGLFIDHGNGVVIGETAVIGDDCTIYQGVTLGGTGKHKGKRHPTIGNNVLIGAGAKVLGPFTVGDNSKIAANAVVLDEVPAYSTCVGVPARVVKMNNVKVGSAHWADLDQIHMPDPVSMEMCKMMVRLEQLERTMAEKKNDKKGE